jgi:hypothetical protein
MTRVHSWLNTASRRTSTIPGEALLRSQYNEFNQLLPDFATETGYTLDTLPFLNLLDLTQEVVTKQLA